MDTEILMWPYSDIFNGGQNNIGDMDHKITLNLQFCQEYVFVAGKKVIHRLTIHNIEKSKQITRTLHPNLETSELYFSWE